MTVISKDVRRMLGLTLHGWENAMLVALIIAGFFALIAGAATWAIVRLQRIEITDSKDEFDRYRLKTAKEISLANARADEAQLALEKFQAPRKLEESQVTRVIAAAQRFRGTPFDVSVNLESEPQNFAAQIGSLLEAAGWVWKNRNNTPGLSIKIGSHEAGLLNGGPPIGLEIDVSKTSDWSAPVLAVGSALQAEGFQPTMNRATDNSASPDAVHLYVGSKR
jgi:hypothetical protein